MKKVLVIISAICLLFLVACQTGNNTKSYQIVYVSGEEVVFRDVVNESTFFLPSKKATRTGYVFDGWYLDKDHLYPMAFQVGVITDLTLYAKWVLNDTGNSDFNIEQWLREHRSLLNELVDTTDQTYTARQMIELVNKAQEEMINKVNQSVVKIEIVSGQYEGSGGSGVIYNKVGNTYYVITNEHVTEGSANNDFRITVFNGSTTKTYANVTKVHETKLKDLAILKFNTSDILNVIEREEPDNIKKGQMVYAMGSPIWFDDLVSQGIVSLPRIQDYDGQSFDSLVIMHTAAINPGNSGGPLINASGKLVGINAYTYEKDDDGTILQLYNFAIHIEEVNQYILGKV